MKNQSVIFLFQIALITHFNNNQSALIAKKYLIENMSIPEKFITIKNSETPCLAKSSFLHLCIDEQQNIKLLKYDAQRTKEIFNKE